MRYLRSLLTLILMAAFMPIMAGDVPLETKAKFIKILTGSAGSAGKVYCVHSDMIKELEKLGVAHDTGSKVAWGQDAAEIKKLKAEKKLVICPQLDLLPLGGSIAIVEENGKPQIYLHMGNIANSGVTLADSVLKIGKRL